MSSARLRPVTAALLLAALSACGSEPDDPCMSITPTVDLTVAPPTFNWTTACAVAALEVAPSDSLEAFAWSILGQPGFNSIVPPVPYGGPAQGGGVGTPVTDSLASGRQYRVTLYRTTGPAGIGLAPVGQAEFTPP